MTITIRNVSQHSQIAPGEQNQRLLRTTAHVAFRRFQFGGLFSFLHFIPFKALELNPLLVLLPRPCLKGTLLTTTSSSLMA